jgi:glycosyltransferase involved in cell wall biosynthesis
LDHAFKIAFLSTYSWSGVPGGASVHTTSVIRHISERLPGKTFLICSSDLPAIEGVVAHKIEPSPFIHISKILETLIGNYRFVGKAAPILRKIAPNILYQRCRLYDQTGVGLSRKLGIPLVLEYNSSEVWTSINMGGKLRLPGTARKIETTNLQRADAVVVVSDELKEDLVRSGVDPEKVFVNYNGADTRLFNPAIDGNQVRSSLGLEPGAIVIGYTGSFGKCHGLFLLAEAAKSLSDRARRYQFLLIGSGPEEEALKKKIREEGLEKSIILAGSLPNQMVPEYLAACDILIAPYTPLPDGSRFFQSPMKIFEYMAMGRPTVTTALGQSRKIIKDGVTGVLVEPDSAEALARAIEKLAESPDLRAAMGRSARLEVEANYTWGRNAARTLEICEEVINKKSSL